MKMSFAILFGMILGLTGTTSCFAADSVDCSASCPDGKKLVSYSDGNTITCSCVDAAVMDETVPQDIPEAANPD